MSAIAAIFADTYGSENEWRFVLSGWALVVVGLGAYAIAVVRKGAKLSKEVKPDERRWMS